MNNKIEWIEDRFRPGRIVYLADLIQNDDIPSGYMRKYYQCQIISIKIGEPIWIRLKLEDPSEYPERPGVIVDKIILTRRKNRHLCCSFRNFDSMIKYVFSTDNISHIDDQDLGLAELVFGDAWRNLYSRKNICPLGPSCSQDEIGHLSYYTHE